MYQWRFGLCKCCTIDLSSHVRIYLLSYHQVDAYWFYNIPQLNTKLSCQGRIKHSFDYLLTANFFPLQMLYLQFVCPWREESHTRSTNPCCLIFQRMDTKPLAFLLSLWLTSLISYRSGLSVSSGYNFQTTAVRKFIFSIQILTTSRSSLSIKVIGSRSRSNEKWHIISNF